MACATATPVMTGNAENLLRGCWIGSCSALVACSGTVYEPPSGVPPVDAPSAAAQAAERPAPDVTPFGMNPLFDASLVDPAAEPFYRASLRQPAKTLAPDAGTSLTALALTETSKAETKQLIADAALLGTKLAEGERAEAPAAAAGGSCVTGIAHGGIGVTELDVFLVDGPADAPVLLAQDTKSGPVAVVGGVSGCVEAPPGARFVVIVRTGSGPIVARLYRRPP